MSVPGTSNFMRPPPRTPPARPPWLLPVPASSPTTRSPAPARSRGCRPARSRWGGPRPAYAPASSSTAPALPARSPGPRAHTPAAAGRPARARPGGRVPPTPWAPPPLTRSSGPASSRPTRRGPASGHGARPRPVRRPGVARRSQGRRGHAHGVAAVRVERHREGIRAVRTAAEPRPQVVLALQLDLAHGVGAGFDLQQLVEQLLVGRQGDPTALQLGGEVPEALRPAVRELDAGQHHGRLEPAVVLFDAVAHLPQPIEDAGPEADGVDDDATPGLDGAVRVAPLGPVRGDAVLLAQHAQLPDGLHRIAVGPGGERQHVDPAADAHRGLVRAVARRVYAEDGLGLVAGVGLGGPALRRGIQPAAVEQRLFILGRELREDAAAVVVRPNAEVAGRLLDVGDADEPRDHRATLDHVR